MFKDYKRMFIFDTETNSLSPEPCGEILELGGILLTKPEGSDKFSERKDISILIKNKYPKQPYTSYYSWYVPKRWYY
mgnify:CR=1 FL=1